MLRMFFKVQNHLCKTLTNERADAYKATRLKMMTEALTKLEKDTIASLIDSIRESEVTKA